MAAPVFPSALCVSIFFLSSPRSSPPLVPPSLVTRMALAFLLLQLLPSPSLSSSPPSPSVSSSSSSFSSSLSSDFPSSRSSTSRRSDPSSSLPPLDPSSSASSLLGNPGPALPLPPLDLVFPYMHLSSAPLTFPFDSPPPGLSSSVPSTQHTANSLGDQPLVPSGAPRHGLDVSFSPSSSLLQTSSSPPPPASPPPPPPPSLPLPSSSSSSAWDSDAKEAAVQELLHRHRLKQAEEKLLELEKERRRQQALQDEVRRRADAELAMRDAREHRQTLHALEVQRDPAQLGEYRQALARAVLEASQRQKQLEGNLQLREIRRQLEAEVDAERQRQNVLRQVLLAKTGREEGRANGELAGGAGHGAGGDVGVEGGGAEGGGGEEEEEEEEEDSDDEAGEEGAEKREKKQKALARGEVVLDRSKGKWKRLKEKLKGRREQTGKASPGGEQRDTGHLTKEDHQEGGALNVHQKSAPNDDESDATSISSRGGAEEGEGEEKKKEAVSSTADEPPENRGFSSPITRFFAKTFRSLRSLFSRSRVEEAAAKVNTVEELSAEYLRCLNIGSARSNFRMGEAYCRSLPSNSHRRFCSGLVQMAMQLLEGIRRCQKSRRGSHRRACFFTAKAPLMHPTLVELLPNATEQYIDGFLTRAPNFQVVSLATERRIDQHVRALDWRGLLRHSFDTVTIAASNRLWRGTAAELGTARKIAGGGLPATRRRRMTKRNQTIEILARRFHATQQEILEMGPHADPLFVGLLHAIVYENNVCQSRPDYGARIVRTVGGHQVTTSVKEQAKIAFVRFIQSLYSIEECAHPPFLHQSEMEDEDEQSIPDAPTGEDNDDEDQGESLGSTSTAPSPSTTASHRASTTTNRTDSAHHTQATPRSPSALRRMQNCELVRRLFNRSLDKKREEETKENPPSGEDTERTGEGAAQDKSRFNKSPEQVVTNRQSSRGDRQSEGGEEGDEGGTSNEALEKLSEWTSKNAVAEQESERYLTPLQKKERKEYIKYLNAAITSQATLTAAIALSTRSRTYKIVSFLAKSKLTAKLLVQLASKFVLRVLRLSRNASSPSGTSTTGGVAPPRSSSSRSQDADAQTDGGIVQRRASLNALVPKSGEEKKSSRYEGRHRHAMTAEAAVFGLGMGAVAEMLTGQDSMGRFATQLMTAALRARRRHLKRLAAARSSRWALWRWGASRTGSGSPETDEASTLRKADGVREGEDDEELGERRRLYSKAKKDGYGGLDGEDESLEETPEIEQARFLARLFTSLTAVFAGSLLLVTTGAWAIPLLLAVGIVGVSLIEPEEEEIYYPEHPQHS